MYFQVKIRVLVNKSATMSLSVSQLRLFCWDQWWINKNVIFFILYSEMCHQLEVLHKTQWTSIFQMTNECIMLQNHEWVKDPFNMKDRQIDFNIPEHEAHWYSFWFHVAGNLLINYDILNFSEVSKRNIYS